MLYDPCIGYIGGCVIDRCISLEVVTVRQIFFFKTERSVFECSEFVIEVLVNRACVDHLIEGIFLILAYKILICCAELYINAAQHILHKLRITADRDSLISVVEIIVVKGKPYGKPLDDERGKFGTLSSPLLLRVAFYQLFIDIFSDKRYSLLFEIFGILLKAVLLLLVDDLLCFFRSLYSPHLTERVHIERKVVKLISVFCNGSIDEVVELGKPVYIVPDLFIGGMEDMCSVLVHVYAVFFGGVDISRYVFPFVDNETFLSFGRSFMSEHCAKESGTDYQIIISHLR